VAQRILGCFGCAAVEGRNIFFLEKKKRETSIPLRALPGSRAPVGKGFLLLFFKKEDLPFLSLCVG
jgi:hypothetical protein